MSNKQHRTLIPLFDELSGKRVIVRPYRQGDGPALFEAVEESREHIRPWLPWGDQHQSVEDSQDYVTQCMAKWLLRENLSLGIWEKETGRCLGGTGLHPHSWEARHFEIGYWLRLSAEGRGYMTEAVRLLTEYAFTDLKTNRLVIRCDERNERSAAVPQRLGYVCEALRRNDMLAPDGSLRNTLVFVLTPEEYARARQSW